MNILSPTAKKLMGTGFILLGFGAFGLSAHTYMNPLQEPDSLAVKAQAINSCKKHAEDFGYLANQKGDSVEFIQQGLSNWDMDLGGFSMVMYKCDGFVLDDFCMGSECKANENTPIYGTIMRLTYKGGGKTTPID